ncbi:hypothetical protein Tco_1568642 [Tanacetum coccineum]
MEDMNRMTFWVYLSMDVRAAVSVSLSVRSESDVDEDSWFTFLMYHYDRSGNELLVLQLQRPFPCLLLHAVWELLLTLDP